jgi:hypothetical protein
MSEIANLFEGGALAAVGAFMVFMPKRADQVHAVFPLIRTGGKLRAPFGWAALALGIGLIAVWCVSTLYGLLQSK